MKAVAIIIEHVDSASKVTKRYIYSYTTPTRLRPKSIQYYDIDRSLGSHFDSGVERRDGRSPLNDPSRLVRDSSFLALGLPTRESRLLEIVFGMISGSDVEHGIKLLQWSFLCLGQTEPGEDEAEQVPRRIP